MRKLIPLPGLVLAIVLACSGPAFASTGVPGQGVGLPIVSASSATVPPPGFSSNADEAIAAAKSSPEMRQLHHREHPLSIRVFVWGGRYWLVDFLYRGKLAGEAQVGPAGRVTGAWTGPLASALYARGHYAPLFDSWWVVVPFSLLFGLPFVSLRRPWRMLHLDLLVLLSFLVSYYLFDHAQLQAAVWMVYPPLVYLLVRLLWVGTRPVRRGHGVSSSLPMPVLAVGLLALVAARVALSLASHEVIDVGYASVIGAHRILHGQSLYYAAPAHADTYGPVAYLAYVPFVLLFPWHGRWDYLPSAHAASIFFDLVTIIGLVVVGRRLRGGRQGMRLGLGLGWAWASCPFTLLGLMTHTDDGLVAMLSVLALVAFSWPATRGAVLGLAAAAKFSPAALLPLFAGARREGPRRALSCVVGFAGVLAIAIGLFLPSGGLAELYNHTIGYQLRRSDVFSIWALHPGLDLVKLALEAAVMLLAGALAFTPRRLALPQLCALSGAVLVAVQLPAVHWFYYYIIWFLPFALVALITPRPLAPEASDRLAHRTELEAAPRAPAEPALAGV